MEKNVCFSARGIFLVIASSVALSDLGATAFGQTYAQLQSQASPSSTQIHLSLGSGLATFQDIQLPATADGVRLDGLVATAENTTHAGIPIIAQFGLKHGFESWTLNFGLEAFQTEASIGDPYTRAASYARFDSSFSAERAFNLGDFEGFTLLGISGRRDLFKNISTAHFVDSVPMRFTVGTKFSEKAQIQAFAATSLVSRFGYDQGKTLQTKALPGTTVSQNEAGIGFQYRVGTQAWVDMGFESEQSQVNITDISAYRAYGMAIEPRSLGRTSARSYQLSTYLARFGLRRQF